MSIIRIALVDGIGVVVALSILTVFARLGSPRLGLVVCLGVVGLYMIALLAFGIVPLRPRAHGL